MWLLIGFIGLLLGVLAFYLLPASYRGGIIGTMLVGSFAALIGAIMANRVGMLTQQSGGFAGLVCAVVVLGIWRVISPPFAR